MLLKGFIELPHNAMWPGAFLRQSSLITFPLCFQLWLSSLSPILLTLTFFLGNNSFCVGFQIHFQSGVVTYAYSSSPWKAKQRGLWDQGQPRLHSKTPSKKNHFYRSLQSSLLTVSSVSVLFSSGHFAFFFVFP